MSMRPLALRRHHPAPFFVTADFDGKAVSLRDYSFRHDLLLVFLHGPGCVECAILADELLAHRRDWEDWGTALLVLVSDDAPFPDLPFRQGRDPGGAERRRWAGEADAVIAALDHRLRLMDGWWLRHPEPVDWHEIAETARWVAVQEPECGACEVLPGWDEV